MKRDERNSSGEEGDGNPRAQNRQASEEAVRKLQFETARRILFSTETVPGSNPPREWWTSAGFLRYDDLQFEEEFQLGPYTLKVTEGSRQDNLLFAAPVWLQMTGDIGNWYRSDVRMDPTDTSRDIMVAGGRWVCVGILKSDTFVSIVPNFLNLTAVQLFDLEEGTAVGNMVRQRKEYFYPEPDARSDYLEAVAVGTTSGAYTGMIDESSVYQRIKDDNPELDSDNEEDKQKLEEMVEEDQAFELFHANVLVEWKQLQPGSNRPVSVLEKGFLFEENSWDPDNDRGDTYETFDGGIVRTSIDQSGEMYWVTYEGPIPFDFLVPYLDHRVPEPFLSSFLSPSVSPVPIDRAKAIFSFTGPNDYWRNVTHETVWHAADIAAVSFVQSYLVYILSGPDKRRFLPDSTDKSPMKETQLPPCLLKLRPRAKAPTQLALVVDANNGREVVSGSVYFRFFFETLASRAYSASLKVMGLSKLRKDSQVGIPEFIDKFSKFMAGTFDTEALTGIFAALEAVKERSERTEFLSAELVGKPVGTGLRRGKFGKGRSPSPRFRRSGPSVGRGGIARRRKDGPGTRAMGRRAVNKGYTSRKTFIVRPGVQHKWGHGLGFGGYRWGYWNKWRFPWLYAYNSWYPWWFFLDPVFYAEKRAYVDAESKWAWGIPPAGPGEWGPVAPPQSTQRDKPPGVDNGYPEPPNYPEGEQLSVDLPSSSPVKDADQEIGAEAEDIGRSIPDTLKAKYAKSKKVADLKNRPLGELVEYLVELVDEAGAQRKGNRIAGDEVALANNLSNHLRSRGATRAKFPKLGKAQDALVKLTSTRLAARQGKRAAGRQQASQARRAAQDAIDQGSEDQGSEGGGGEDQQQEIEARAPRDENDDGDGTAPRPKKQSGGGGGGNRRSAAPAKTVYMKNLSKRQKAAWDKVWFARRRLRTAETAVSDFKAIADGKDFQYQTLAQRRNEVSEAQRDVKRQTAVWYSTGMKVDIDDVVDTKGIDADIGLEQIGQELSENADLIASQLLMTRIGTTRRY